MPGHDDLWDNDLDGPRPWILRPDIEDRRPSRTNRRIENDTTLAGWPGWVGLVADDSRLLRGQPDSQFAAALLKPAWNPTVQTGIQVPGTSYVIHRD